MIDPGLVRVRGTQCQVKLACGHWSQVMSSRSSTFDFPCDLLPCGDCRDMRYMAIPLMNYLIEVRG